MHPSRNSDTLKGNYEVTPIEKTMTARIDRETYDELMRQGLPYVDTVIGYGKVFFVVWIIVSPFITALVKLAGYALYLLLGALILWIIDMAFLKKNFRYGELYRLSLYGITIPALIAFVLNQAGMHVPFVFTAAFIAWMTYVLSAFPARAKLA